jgi:hypothetical protein
MMVTIVDENNQEDDNLDEHLGPRKWFKILKQFVKDKGIKAEEIQQLTSVKDQSVPLDFI